MGLRDRLAAATAVGPLAERSTVERLLAVGGAVALLAGGILLVAQWVVPGGRGLADLGDSKSLLALALFGVLEGLAVALLTRKSPTGPTDLPTPEPPSAVAPRPGDEFDPASIGGRRQLRELAVQQLAADRDIDRERARELVETDEWQAPPSVVAYLGGDAYVPLSRRFEDWLAREDRETLRARRALAAIRDLQREGEQE